MTTLETTVHPQIDHTTLRGHIHAPWAISSLAFAAQRQMTVDRVGPAGPRDPVFGPRIPKTTLKIGDHPLSRQPQRRIMRLGSTRRAIDREEPRTARLWLARQCMAARDERSRRCVPRLRRGELKLIEPMMLGSLVFAQHRLTFVCLLCCHCHYASLNCSLRWPRRSSVGRARAQERHQGSGLLREDGRSQVLWIGYRYPGPA